MTGPVVGVDEVERTHQRVHTRTLSTVFGKVEVDRLGYGGRGLYSLHPLDAALNLPGERHSLEVRRRVAEAAAKGAFDEAWRMLTKATGAPALFANMGETLRSLKFSEQGAQGTRGD